MSLYSTAESLVVANAMTNLFFDTNLGTFVTGKNVAGGFGVNGKNNSWEVTGRELFDLVLGGSGGISSNSFPDGISGVLKRNIKENLATQGTVIVAAPLIFRSAKNLLRKPVINPANKLLKMAGIKGVKV